MINFPNAKINLGLQITEKRTDCYHNIDSCFYPIPLEDILEVIPSKVDEFNFHGLSIAGKSTDNLIWKAYQLLKQEFQLPPINISLYKNIPMGAGMGGGSADGAFMLKLLNDKFELGLSKDLLKDYALQLGSDCPFFIDNSPAYVTGRGEALAPIKVNLKGYYLGLILPGIHISTQEAYAQIVPNKERETVKSIIEHAPLADWQAKLENDFETSVFKKHPTLKEQKDKLYKVGAVYASMSGSGSTLYGIFDKKINSSYIDQWINL